MTRNTCPFIPRPVRALSFSLSITAAIFAVGCASNPPAGNGAGGAAPTAKVDKSATKGAAGSRAGSPAVVEAEVNAEADEAARRMIAAIDQSRKNRASRALEAPDGSDGAMADTEAIDAAPQEPAGAETGGKQAAPRPSPVASPKASPKIEWVAGSDLRAVDLAPARNAHAPAVGESAKPAATEAARPATATNAAPHANAADANLAALDRDTLLKLLRQRIEESGDSETSAALSYAALALADSKFKLDPIALSKMRPTQRELAVQFFDLFSALGKQVEEGKSIDRKALGDKINAIVGEQPVAIRTLKLCERVRGFGVYEELPSDTFLAGREQPMVVYVEVDHFRSSPNELRNGFQVKLTQELVLYNESDGLAVWRQPEEQIVDESRNQRRDFFIVQPTRLPARLGVGKYILKVRVRDIHGGTRDETSVPVHVVADPALVKPDVKREEKRGS